MTLNRTFPDIPSFAAAVVAEIQAEVAIAVAPIQQELDQLKLVVASLDPGITVPPPAPPPPPTPSSTIPSNVTKPLQFKAHPLASESQLIRDVKIFQYLDLVGTNSVPTPEYELFIAAVNDGWINGDAFGLETLLAWRFLGESARLAAGLTEFNTWYMAYITDNNLPY